MAGILVRIFMFLLGFLPLFGDVTSEKGEALEELIQPYQIPMVVKTGFYLLDLISINEHDQTFKADVYFSFSWKDPRLMFTGEKEQIYAEDAAKEKLSTIWWPDPEFINTGAKDITNETLYIYPDGRVEYVLGFASDFWTAFDYRRFPFDLQNLKIVLSSFIWNKDWLVFTSDPSELDYSKSEAITFKEKAVQKIDVEILNEKRGFEPDTYSTFVATISVKRNPAFYLYQVFVPNFIVLLVAYCIFFINPKEFASRLTIGLTSLLVFTATKFVIDRDLPRLGYITLLDKLFFIFYFCGVITVIVSLIERIMMERKHPTAKKIDKYARIYVPILFIILFVVFFFTASGS
jgi:hypothetical protein